MENFNPKIEALKVALKKLFKESHFSICTIDNLLKMMGKTPDPELYKIMQSIHCADYKDMTPEFKRFLFISIVDLFGADTYEFDIESIEKMDPKTVKIKLLT